MNGLLINKGESAEKNIGDYIQSVAQETFFQKIDLYVEREELKYVNSKEKINLIMNGWFMRHPENFPPSEAINPLFISFHLTPSIIHEVLNENTLLYLKKYEPIGCRDLFTKNILESRGINSYFSGCLTLTLGKKYYNDNKDDSYYFVDPYYELGACQWPSIHSKTIKSIILLIKNYWSIRKILPKFTPEYYSIFSKYFPWLHKAIMCASFFEAYKTVFNKEILENAEYINHKVNQSSFNNEDEKLEYARKLIVKYSKASLVVTSRIHCALPCLGVETPVIFVTSDVLQGNSLRSSGRFDGILDLFHVLKWTPNGLHGITCDIKKTLRLNKISPKNILNNNPDYKYYRDMLIKVVDNWINNDYNIK